MNFNARTFLIGLLTLVALINIILLTSRTIRQQTQPAVMPLHSLADQFRGLENVFAHIPRAGYYSDKNMELSLAIAQYEQAQYILTPTVLELNNTNLPLVLFDCTNPDACLNQIKTLGLQPLSANNTGIILAINPKLTQGQP